MIKYIDYPEIINGVPLKVEMISGQLHYCAICGKILGSCSVCGKDYGFPFMLFINKGRKGMIVLCSYCLNKLLGMNVR